MLAGPVGACYFYEVARHSFEPGRVVRILVAAGSTANRWRAMKAMAYLLASDAREAEDKIRRLNAEHPPDGGEEKAFWSDLELVLSQPPLKRCLAHVEATGSVDALCLFQPNEQEAERIVEVLLRYEHDEMDVFGRHVLAILWTLGAAAPSFAGEVLPRLKLRSWSERYEAHRLAARLGVDGFLAPTTTLQPARPDWVPIMHPAMHRDPLGGALMRDALSGDGHMVGDANRPNWGWPAELPGEWLLYGDLDHVKTVADYHGHRGGDLVIHGAINALQSVAGDRVIRYGGDELNVLYEGEDGPGYAEQLRVQVERASFEPVGDLSEPLQITISFGAVRARQTTTSLRAAEDALGEAKLAGRNCVVSRS